MKCVICSQPIREIDDKHNAMPVAHGICCNWCNYSRVIPERLREHKHTIDTINIQKGVAMTDIEKAVNLLQEVADNLFDLRFNSTYELGGFAKEKVAETRNKIIDVLPTLDY